MPSLPERPPHPATVIQPRTGPFVTPSQPPHPATIIQPRMGPPVAPSRPPHPATVIQPRMGPPVAPSRPPHPATVIQGRGLGLAAAQPLPPRSGILTQGQTAQLAQELPALKLNSDTLHTISTFFRTYVQKTEDVQEIQALKIGDDLLVSSNFDYEMDPIVAALPSGTTRGEIGAKLDAMVARIDADKHKDAPRFVQAGSVDVLKEKFGRRTPKLPAVTALKSANVTRDHLGSNQIILIPGATRKGDKTTLHAEQNLLKAVVSLIKNGWAPTIITIAGVKVPCKICLEVLKDFQRWYEEVHGRNLVFTEGKDSDRHQTTSPPIEKYDFREDAGNN